MQQDQCRISGLSELTQGTHYNYTALGHTLVKSVIHPSAKEVAAIAKGEATFGIYIEDRVLFFLCKLGTHWTASHYNWWINLPELRPDPAAELSMPDKTISVAVNLMNAGNAQIEAANTFRIPEKPAVMLRQCVCEQIASVLDPWDHLETARKALGRASSLDWMARKASWIACCRPLGPEENDLRERSYGCRTV